MGVGVEVTVEGIVMTVGASSSFIFCVVQFTSTVTLERELVEWRELFR